MPRDLNGTYTLPAGNPVVTGTVITSTWANDTMTDVGSELTDSLSRSGKGGFTAPVGIVDASGSVPGLNFVSEPTSGFKRESSEDIRMQVTTTDIWQGIKTGVKVLTPGSGGVLKHPVVEESGQKVMRGVGGSTTIWFYSSTVPPGWSIALPDALIRNLCVGPAGNGGTIAGDINPSEPTLDVTVNNVSVDLPVNTGGHTLINDEMPSHTHTESAADDSGSGFLRPMRVNTALGCVPTDCLTGARGGDQPHTHPLGGTASQTVGSGTGSTAAFNPRRAQGIFGRLNA